MLRGRSFKIRGGGHQILEKKVPRTTMLNLHRDSKKIVGQGNFEKKSNVLMLSVSVIGRAG